MITEITETIGDASIWVSTVSGQSSLRAVIEYSITGWVNGEWMTDHGSDITVLRRTSDALTVQEGYAALLSFLSAAGESYARSMRERMLLTDTENGDLFAKSVAEWAHMYADEIDVARMDIDSGDSEW